ncbi:hypothetical protein GCM10027063_08850 [Promicromonospora xylanilytica]
MEPGVVADVHDDGQGGCAEGEIEAVREPRTADPTREKGDVHASSLRAPQI